MPVDRPRRLDARVDRARLASVDRARLASLLAAIALAGCYKPSIKDGGLVCSPANACPDGYTCAADHHCWTVPPVVMPTDSGMDMAKDVTPPKGDAGGEGGTCVPPAPMCAAGPAAGDACSPACQRGCACGRCNVIDGKATCVSAGTVKLGDVCNAGADDCAPGLICLLETCGNGLARCYQHCISNDQCAGTACTITIDDSKGNATSYTTCDVPPRACNPVAIGTSGCPNPALNCYLTSANETLCDCPGNVAKQGMNNDPCTIYSDCAAGFICISGVDGQTTPHCHFVCEVANKSCPISEPNCVPAGTGSKYGYCAM
jgi:hypothetical protein